MLLGMAAVFAVTGAGMYLGLPWESATQLAPHAGAADDRSPPAISIAWFGFAGVLPAGALRHRARTRGPPLGLLRIAALALLTLLAYNVAVGPVDLVDRPASWSTGASWRGRAASARC